MFIAQASIPFGTTSTECRMPHAFRSIPYRTRNFSRCLSRQSNWPTGTCPVVVGDTFGSFPMPIPNGRSIGSIGTTGKHLCFIFIHGKLIPINPDRNG